ncbi:hypothetical protein FRX31_020238 [Thalictrum thalictroides]|uniref:Uncharacterized protein n=1 Tax=Thalictrum thalictroides TaxID=46969 RepID=A0A7J6W1H3_THATH|nr:hypothetical protein FRX31_020238 [Thalictrum thalictroides]
MAGGGNQMQEHVSRLETTLTNVVGKTSDVHNNGEGMADDFKKLAENASSELGVLMKAVNNTNQMDVMKANVPKPKAFSEARDAKELEKFPV